MTKKHFEAIAHTLDANYAPLELVLDFADMCAEMSDRFSKARFVEAATKNLKSKMDYDARVLATYAKL